MPVGLFAGCSFDVGAGDRGPPTVLRVVVVCFVLSPNDSAREQQVRRRCMLRVSSRSVVSSNWDSYKQDRASSATRLSRHFGLNKQMRDTAKPWNNRWAEKTLAGKTKEKSYR